MSDKNVQVLMEYFDHKFDSLIEAFQVMTELMHSSMAKDSDLQEVKQDVKTIKAVVTATNQDLRKLKVRVSRLEATG